MKYPLVLCTSDLVKMNFYYNKKSSISRKELDEFVQFIDQDLTEKNVYHTIFYNDKYVKELGEYFSYEFSVTDDSVSLFNECEYRAFKLEFVKSFSKGEMDIIEEVMNDYISKKDEGIGLN